MIKLHIHFYVYQIVDFKYAESILDELSNKSCSEIREYLQSYDIFHKTVLKL